MMPPGEFDLDQLPPHLREGIEAKIRAGKAFEAAITAHNERSHATMMRFAALFCSCKAWYSWTEPGAPQAGCPVHGQLVLRDDGTPLS